MGEVEEVTSSSSSDEECQDAIILPPPAIIDEFDFEMQRRHFNRIIAQNKKKRKTQEPDKEFGWKVKSEKHLWGPSEEELAKFEHSKAERMKPSRPEKDSDEEEDDQVALVDSIFHGAQERDYLGRTYMHPPQDLSHTRLDKAPGSFECFPPKRVIHSWTEHTKGVTTCKILPQSGHLLLSGSQDHRLKVWQIYGDRSCLRTFLGHTRPIKEVWWSSTALGKFASCAYDKTVRYWDGEAGKCLQVIKTPDLPYCVRLHPDPSKPWSVMAGCADKRVLQWDLREINTAAADGGVTKHCLEYNQHLDAVNSITFYEEGRRFVTTSDDKTVRVWEWEIPVATRYIADPEMHSMPVGVLHPDGQSIAFQSLAGQVMVWGVQGDRFFNRRKRFVGHSTGGYACGLAFSPDGRFLASGDAKGHLVVWDWKTGQMVRKLASAHQRVTIDVAWSPQEASRVITASWDGSLALWD